MHNLSTQSRFQPTSLPVPSIKMPITELGLLTPKPDAQLRQELDNKLPGALSDQFSGLPKLDFAYIGTILEASGKDASHQNGLCLFLRRFAPKYSPAVLIRPLPPAINQHRKGRGGFFPGNFTG